MEGALYIINNFVVPAALILSGCFCFVLLFLYDSEGKTKKITIFLLTAIAVLAILIFVLEIPILAWGWFNCKNNAITIVILCIASSVALLCIWLLHYFKDAQSDIKEDEDEDEN